VASGRWRAPLHGIPIALKDKIDTAGIRMTAGSAVLAERVPTTDADVAFLRLHRPDGSHRGPHRSAVGGDHRRSSGEELRPGCAAFPADARAMLESAAEAVVVKLAAFLHSVQYYPRR
jgi:Amidase